MNTTIKQKVDCLAQITNKKTKWSELFFVRQIHFVHMPSLVDIERSIREKKRPYEQLYEQVIYHNAYRQFLIQEAKIKDLLPLIEKPMETRIVTFTAPTKILVKWKAREKAFTPEIVKKYRTMTFMP